MAELKPSDTHNSCFGKYDPLEEELQEERGCRQCWEGESCRNLFHQAAKAELQEARLSAMTLEERAKHQAFLEELRKHY